MKNRKGYRIPVELVAQTTVYAMVARLPPSKAFRVAKTYCKVIVISNRFVQRYLPDRAGYGLWIESLVAWRGP